jgi:hypothetical protein
MKGKTSAAARASAGTTQEETPAPDVEITDAVRERIQKLLDSGDNEEKVGVMKFKEKLLEFWVWCCTPIKIDHDFDDDSGSDTAHNQSGSDMRGGGGGCREKCGKRVGTNGFTLVSCVMITLMIMLIAYEEYNHDVVGHIAFHIGEYVFALWFAVETISGYLKPKKRIGWYDILYTLGSMAPVVLMLIDEVVVAAAGSAASEGSAEASAAASTASSFSGTSASLAQVATSADCLGTHCGQSASAYIAEALAHETSNHELLRIIATNAMLCNGARLLVYLYNFEATKQMPTLRIILGGLLHCWPSFIACVIVVLILFQVFGAVALIVIDMYYKKTGMPQQPRNHTIELFEASVVTAWFEMSRHMFSDEALEHMEDLGGMRAGELETWWWQLFIVFFFYAFMVVSAWVIMNLVTAVILENAMKLAQASEAENALKEAAEAQMTLQKLKVVFTVIDTDGSGKISTCEFKEAFLIPEVKNLLVMLGIEELEALKVFEMLDEESFGEVEIEEFCEGLTKIKGEAQASDLLMCHRKIKKGQQFVKEKFFSTSDCRSELRSDDEVARLHGPVHNAVTDMEHALKDRMDGIDAKCTHLKHLAKCLCERTQRAATCCNNIRQQHRAWMDEAASMFEGRAAPRRNDGGNRRDRTPDRDEGLRERNRR